MKGRAKRYWEVVGEAEIFSPIELSLPSGIVHAIHVSSPNNRCPEKFTSQTIFTWILKETQVSRSQDLSSIRLKGRDVELISIY